MAAPSVTKAAVFGRISKPAIQVPAKCDSPPVCRKSYAWIGTKRKRDDSEVKEETAALTAVPLPCKKPKTSFTSSGPLISSTKGSAVSQPAHGQISTCKTNSAPPVARLSLVLHNLSLPARTLITLHKVFLKALSIHYAHSGSHTPAELGRLLETITRLWKKRSVTQVDVQKMLAIYETNTNVGTPKELDIIHSLGPFKLVMAGLCTSVEFAGQRKQMGGSLSTLFDEKDLHDSYSAHVYALDSAWTEKRRAHLSFLDDDSFDNFPKLARNIGTQTALRKANISQQRTEILALSNAAQLRSVKVSISGGDSSADEISNAITIVESRKQNLLDRIKAKQLACKATSKPTPQQVLRKHALGRIAEVTEILRMMQQQQKVERNFRSHEHTSTVSCSNNRSGKVSFSLAQIRSNAKVSARVPISDEEVIMCLKMLSEELDGSWVRMIERTSAPKAAFVVIEGEGMSGKEVQKRLMAREVA